MSKLARNVNEQTARVLDRLSVDTQVVRLSDLTPVMATPAAVAAGVTGAVTAGVGGFVAEEVVGD